MEMGLAAFNRARRAQARVAAEAQAALQERQVQEADDFPEADAEDAFFELSIAELTALAGEHDIDLSPLGARPVKARLVGFLRHTLGPDVGEEPEEPEEPEDDAGDVEPADEADEPADTVDADAPGEPDVVDAGDETGDEPDGEN
jgi:hypothetical protein